jgi:hypothetical protein
MKKLIGLGVFVGGTIGAILGNWLDHGNSFGAWTLILSTLGSFVGIWAAVQLNDYL